MIVEEHVEHVYVDYVVRLDSLCVQLLQFIWSKLLYLHHLYQLFQLTDVLLIQVIGALYFR